VGCYGHITKDYPRDARKFDATLWKVFADNVEPDNPRGQMYDDLVQNFPRKGLIKSEIEALLGPADLRSDNNFMSYNSACGVDIELTMIR